MSNHESESWINLRLKKDCEVYAVLFNVQIPVWLREEEARIAIFVLRKRSAPYAWQLTVPFHIHHLSVVRYDPWEADFPPVDKCKRLTFL